jgi:hypothetical protein
MGRKEELNRSEKMDLSGPVKLINRKAFESLATEATSPSVNATGRATAKFSVKSDDVQREVQASRRGFYTQPRKLSGPFSSVVLAVSLHHPTLLVVSILKCR